MGALTPTAGLVGGNSITFKVTGTAADTITNAALTAILAAAGTNSTAQQQMRNFLATVFADMAAADLAFRAIGGYIAVRQTAGTPGTSTPIITWVCTAAVPAIDIAWTGLGAASELEITIGARHSIIH